MIEIQHLTRRYGDKLAVDDISFKIRNGHIYGLLGPNGAGKSTTMNMIAGCLAPTEGTVLVGGYDICKNPLEAKRQIGYLPEQPPLFADMTPLEYLSFVAEAKGVKDDHLDRQVKEVMTVTNLISVKDTLIRNLSKGFRQRVGIAQALLGKPDTIILDEPTVGLDPAQLTEIRALIRRLGEKLTVVISSHILSEISELCDHVIILSHGKLVADDELSALEARMSSEKTLLLTVKGETSSILSALEAIEGILSVKVLREHEDAVDIQLKTAPDVDLRDAVFYAMADNRCPVVSMEAAEQSLEDIFLALTADRERNDENHDDDSDTDEEVTD